MEKKKENNKCCGNGLCKYYNKHNKKSGCKIYNDRNDCKLKNETKK